MEQSSSSDDLIPKKKTVARTRPTFTAALDHYGVDYRHHHGWQNIRCPVTPESTPSARVNLELAAFFCNSCGASGGDVWDFIKLMESTDFKGALAVAETMAGDKEQYTSSGAVKTSSGPGRKYRPKLKGRKIL